MASGGDERSDLKVFVTVAMTVIGGLQGDEAFVLPPEVRLAGLRMAAGDVLEAAAGLAADERAMLERRLAEAGAPSLGDIGLRYLKRLKAILERGVIRSEAEYHLVRNFAEGADPKGEGAPLWALLNAYEQV